MCAMSPFRAGAQRHRCAIIESEGRYLLVEEHTRRPEAQQPGRPPGPRRVACRVVREALEKRRDLHPEALVGVYLSRFRRPLPVKT